MKNSRAGEELKSLCKTLSCLLLYICYVHVTYVLKFFTFKVFIRLTPPLQPPPPPFKEIKEKKTAFNIVHL